MQLTDIRLNSRFLALGDSADESFSDADILRESNLNYRGLMALAVKAQGDFSMQDLTKQTISILAGTRVYALASTFLVLKRVEIKYPNSMQDYLAAKQISENTIPPRGKDDYVTPNPQYDLAGTNLEIFVSQKTADIEAVASGIYVYYEDEITALVGVTTETILPEFANRLLCLHNAKDYCGVNGLTTRLSWLIKEIGKQPDSNGRGATGETAKFLNFLETRSEDKRANVAPRKEDYGQAGLGSDGGFPPSINGS